MIEFCEVNQNEWGASFGVLRRWMVGFGRRRCGGEDDQPRRSGSTTWLANLWCGGCREKEGTVKLFGNMAEGKD